MTLVILAAGMGSRYGGLKQLDPIGPHGEFIIDYSIYDAVRCGYDKVVFIIKEENYELFRDTIGKRAEKIVSCEYVFQKPEKYLTVPMPDNRVKPFGTAHALLCAGEKVYGNFAVINADDFYGRESFKIVKDYLENAKKEEKSHYCMAGYILGNTLSDIGSVSRGVCTTDECGKLLSIKENKKLTRGNGTALSEDEEGNITEVALDRLVSMNFYGFTSDIFEHCEKSFSEFLINDLPKAPLKAEFGLPTAVDNEIKSGRADVSVIPTPAKWFGVTYSEDKPEVQAKLKALHSEGLYPEDLWG